MKYYRFTEAQSETLIPGVGPVPFYLEGATAVTCVEFTPNEMRAIRDNGNRLYLLIPVTPGADRPIFVKPHVGSPFINPNVKNNGIQIKRDAPDKSQGDDKQHN